jgi:hypothetical protein
VLAARVVNLTGHRYLRCNLLDYFRDLLRIVPHRLDCPTRHTASLLGSQLEAAERGVDLSNAIEERGHQEQDKARSQCCRDQAN